MITYAIPSGRPTLPPIGGPGHEMDVRPSAVRPSPHGCSHCVLARGFEFGGRNVFGLQSIRPSLDGRSGSCSLSPHGRTDNSVTISFSFVQQSHISYTNGRSTLTPYRDLAKLLMLALPLSRPILAPRSCVLLQNSNVLRTYGLIECRHVLPATVAKMLMNFPVRPAGS